MANSRRSNSTSPRAWSQYTINRRIGEAAEDMGAGGTWNLLK